MSVFILDLQSCGGYLGKSDYEQLLHHCMNIVIEKCLLSDAREPDTFILILLGILFYIDNIVRSWSAGGVVYPIVISGFISLDTIVMKFSS